MMARLVKDLPEGPEWLYEVKLDGYRAMLSKRDGDIRLRSRNDKDLAPAYPEITAAARALRPARLLLDGEIVAVGRDGMPSFQALQHRSAHPGHHVVFYAFDLLAIDDISLLEQPLASRRRRLPDALRGSGVLISETLDGSAADVVAAVRRLGLEGVIAKRRDAPYQPGMRSDAWRKVKLEHQQEFVVGGYRPGPLGVDALLVGYYEQQALRFAGKVRAGFTPHVRRQVYAELRRRHAPACPFVDLPNSRTSHWGGGVTAEQMAEMQWLKPEAVAQIRFVEWTAEGHLRHAAFIGMRTDVRAGTVRRERA